MQQPIEVCRIDGCDAAVRVKSRGWCIKHYTRWTRGGDPLRTSRRVAMGSPMTRWLAKVDKTDTCWLWTAHVDPQGYGRFAAEGPQGGPVMHRAHRWGYEQLVRPLDGTEVLDHLCRVRHCVNPEHLEPVTQSENIARGLWGAWNAGRQGQSNRAVCTVTGCEATQHGRGLCRVHYGRERRAAARLVATSGHAGAPHDRADDREDEAQHHSRGRPGESEQGDE
jgi:hypothetical protein